MKINNYLNKVIIGQLLADGHVEQTGKNCRLSFSFGSTYLIYAHWIYSIFEEYSSNSVYNVVSKTKGVEYTNYRLKTKTLSDFNVYREMFYEITESGKYKKIVPDSILDTMCPIVLAHLIMGDGSFSKSDNRIRIYTNHYTYQECMLLATSITKNCSIECKVMFDRLSVQKQEQYILTIGKSQLNNVQNITKAHMCNSIMYRIGL